jgi:ABC-type glycerol-3-phosphate transport system permease component
LPLSGPVLAVVATFTFVDKWTQFLAPLIYLNSDEMRTVALGIALNKGLYNAAKFVPKIDAFLKKAQEG